MQGAVDRFLSVVALERARHAKRLRLSLLIAALIFVLIYQTQWLILRPGLVVLLVGQAGSAIAIMSRSRKLAKELEHERTGEEEDDLLAWFEAEERFLKQLAAYEAGCQMLGFACLGYEFWVASGSFWLAVAIGLVYPITTYFGITRRRYLSAIKRLRSERKEVALNLLRPISDT